MSAIALSVVVPIHNERDNIQALVFEIRQALDGVCTYEIIYVDDHSTDGSLELLLEIQSTVPQLRVLAHTRCCGQSAGLRTGIAHAQAPWVATLDGDGQNAPSDIIKLLAARDQADAHTKLFAGWRVHRQDTRAKRWASRFANALRSALLRDNTPDTGCGIKLIERSVFLRLPFFDHIHRYLPALVQREGWKTHSIPVDHRHRRAGVSKYTNMRRALVGVRDLLGVSWLIARYHRVDLKDLS